MTRDDSETKHVFPPLMIIAIILLGLLVLLTLSITIAFVYDFEFLIKVMITIVLGLLLLISPMMAMKGWFTFFLQQLSLKEILLIGTITLFFTALYLCLPIVYFSDPLYFESLLFGDLTTVLLQGVEVAALIVPLLWISISFYLFNDSSIPEGLVYFGDHPLRKDI